MPSISKKNHKSNTNKNITVKNKTKSKSNSPSKNKNSFVLFGCWNSKFCNIESNKNMNGMSSVMSKLYDKTTSTPDFYIIAGDNYYPKKSDDKKKKYFNNDDFESGMNCARKLQENAPVYMIMGNHDLDQNNKLYDVKDDKTKLDECFITKKQKEYLNEFRMNIPFTKLADHTLIIFLNTSLYSQNFEDVDRCIQYFNDLGGMSISEVITYFETQIDKIVKKNNTGRIKNIILVGHHPILSLRIKEKEKKGDIVITDTREPLRINGLNFLQRIYVQFPNASKYYLCADVHQYQEVDIHIDGLNSLIKQYVVGTGGTDLDDKTCHSMFENPTKMLSFERVPNSILKYYPRVCDNKNYGYLECNSNSNGELSFNFVETCSRKKCGASD